MKIAMTAAEPDNNKGKFGWNRTGIKAGARLGIATNGGSMLRCPQRLS